MTPTAALLVAAGLLVALPAGATAQHAAKHLRSYSFHTDRRHLTIRQRSTSALQFRPTPRASTPSANAGPPRLQATGRLPLHLSWSATDIALASAFTAALLIDHGQTRRLARAGWQGWRETNPILGPRPSVGQLDTYATVSAVAVLGTAAVLPARFRSWFLGAAFVVEGFTVAGSMQRGLAIRLP